MVAPVPPLYEMSVEALGWRPAAEARLVRIIA
jgi:hypothetical protein